MGGGRPSGAVTWRGNGRSPWENPARVPVVQEVAGVGPSRYIDTYPGIVEMVKPSNTVIFLNARIDMFRDTMWMAIDKLGLIEEPAGFEVNEDNNVSKVEYKLVNVSKVEYKLVNVPLEKVSVRSEEVNLTLEKVKVPLEERY